MRLALVLLFDFVSSVLVSGTEYYAETFDNVNVDTILNSDRLFNQYMDCILDVGPCTADGRTLRYILPDALATTCSKCNPKQKEIARKLANHIKNNKPQVWTKFLQKFDPNGEYATIYEQFLDSS
ncbi:Csp8 [Eciton burchellii]|nr:Csp8 [Eciton burchellii]